ncbi:hypothetical protein FB451DRAFT_1529256 [Mycena latifolia]|nr:hypothetical protein FB451DRAFT_1529256 [Mycena latifolia]
MCCAAWRNAPILELTPDLDLFPKATASVSPPDDADSPPPYPDAGVPTAGEAGPGTRPTNLLLLDRGNSPLKGSYVIDPRIVISQALLPPLAPDEERRNAVLRTTAGPIDVDLSVVGEAGCKPVEVLIESGNGTIAARLHAADFARPPLRVRVQSAHGHMAVHLPRSFRGPVTLRTRSPTVRLSAPLAAEITPLSEADNTRRCFIGDFSAYTDAEAWAGDELRVESSAYGSVRFSFDDEPKASSLPAMGVNGG